MGKRCSPKTKKDIHKETVKGAVAFEANRAWDQSRATASKHRRLTMAGLAKMKAPKVGHASNDSNGFPKCFKNI